MPEFSIIIPVYHGERCVEQCIASLTTQSFGDFEILCVDDASEDGSAAVLSRLSEEDRRVRVIGLERNGGCSRARRLGVLSSKGDYVLFADQDDAYAPGALQRLHDELVADPVDILAFDADVESVDGVGEEEVRGVREWMKAPQVRLSGRRVLDACFLDNEYGYSLWNKDYRGDMARCAFAATEDETVPLGEDNYAYFVLAYFAGSLRGIPGAPLYRYRYGAGFTGHGSMSLAAWRRTSTLAEAADLIRRFLERQGTWIEYEDVHAAARAHMVEYAFDHYRTEISEEDRSQALAIALEYWTYEEVLEGLARSAPGDLPLLVDARFGDDPARIELREWVEEQADTLSRMDEIARARREEAARLRERYESSRAYRLGRKATAPLRLLRR